VICTKNRQDALETYALTSIQKLNHPNIYVVVVEDAPAMGLTSSSAMINLERSACGWCATSAAEVCAMPAIRALSRHTLLFRHTLKIGSPWWEV